MIDGARRGHLPPFGHDALTERGRVCDLGSLGDEFDELGTADLDLWASVWGLEVITRSGLVGDAARVGADRVRGLRDKGGVALAQLLVGRGAIDHLLARAVQRHPDCRLSLAPPRSCHYAHSKDFPSGMSRVRFPSLTRLSRPCLAGQPGFVRLPKRAGSAKQHAAAGLGYALGVAALGWNGRWQYRFLTSRSLGAALEQVEMEPDRRRGDPFQVGTPSRRSHGWSRTDGPRMWGHGPATRGAGTER